MRLSRLLFLSLAAAGLFAVGASVAAANEFRASQFGKLTGKGTTTQVLTVTLGTVKCKEEKAKGQAPQEKLTAVVLEVEYSGCEFFLGKTEKGEKAIVSQAKWEFLTNEKATISSEVMIKAPSCEFKIPATGNKELGKATYGNLTKGNLQIKAAVKGITSTGGGLCAGKGSEGSYEGGTEVELGEEGALAFYQNPGLRFKATNGGVTNVVSENPVGTLHIFEFGAGKDKVECKKAKFSASINNVSPTLTFAPAYEKCELIETGMANRVANVEPSPCSYMLSGPVASGTMFVDGWYLTPDTCKTLIKFPAIAGCEVKIERNQLVGQPTAFIRIENKGGPPATGMLLKFAITHYFYDSNSNGANNCPAAGFAEQSVFGSYKGDIKEEAEGIVIG